MRSYLAHYKNKYPGGRVDYSDGRLDVYDADGELRVALRINGAGNLVDIGPEIGALDKHDLDPIPKNARVFKHYSDNTVKLSEEAAERKGHAKSLVSGGKILSIKEYKALGFDVDSEGKVSADRRKLSFKIELAPHKIKFEGLCTLEFILGRSSRKTLSHNPNTDIESTQN